MWCLKKVNIPPQPWLLVFHKPWNKKPARALTWPCGPARALRAPAGHSHTAHTPAGSARARGPGPLKDPTLYLQSKSQGWESEKESSASPLLNDPDTFSKSPPVLVPTSYFAVFPPNWPNVSPLAYPCLNWRILWNLRTHSSLAIWIRNARAATAPGATILADEKAIHLTEMKA